MKSTLKILLVDDNRDLEGAARRIFDIGLKIIGATAGYVAMLFEDGLENEVLFLESGRHK